jgi:hypothetical protein
MTYQVRRISDGKVISRGSAVSGNAALVEALAIAMHLAAGRYGRTCLTYEGAVRLHDLYRLGIGDQPAPFSIERV